MSTNSGIARIALQASIGISTGIKLKKSGTHDMAQMRTAGLFGP
jgi:hypothetical protein